MSSLSSYIKSGLDLLSTYFVPLAILIGALLFLYWVFSSGRVKLLSQMIIDARNKKLNKQETINKIVKEHKQTSNQEYYIPKDIEQEFEVFRSIE